MFKGIQDNPKALALIGMIALVPQALFVALEFNLWHRTGRDLELLITSPTIEAIAVVGAAVICPMIAIMAGIGLIRNGWDRSTGRFLVAAAPILLLAAFMARP
jgi:hypothetical protein